MKHLGAIFLHRQVSRLFWLLMAVSHVPALWKALVAGMHVGFSADQVSKCAILAGSLVFFALKSHGVRFLGGGSTRQSCIVFYVIIALLHVDLMAPSNSSLIVAEYRDIVVSTLVIGQILADRRRCKELEHGESGRCDEPVKSSVSSSWDTSDSISRIGQQLVGQSLGMRAPPFA